VTARHPNRIAAVVLSTIVVAFVGLVVVIVSATLTEHEAPMFEPTPVEPWATPPTSIVLDTITIDARDPDQWVFVDFMRQSVVYPPDTLGWDLAFRRFRVIASGIVADLGLTTLGAPIDTPETAYIATRFGADTVNAAIDRWYSYSFITHLLTAKDNVYAARNRDGTAVQLRFLGYYCPGMQAGCVTFRFRFDPQHHSPTPTP
jgi:hypothetical protein